jgi:hypothetical protein
MAGRSPDIPNAVLAVMDDIRGFPNDFAGNVLASIAVSLRRIADMMEEANRPQIRLMEEGEIPETERRRRLLEGLEKDVANGARIAAALEAMAAQGIGTADAPNPGQSSGMPKGGEL